MQQRHSRVSFFGNSRLTVSAASGSFSASFLQHEVVPDKRISIGIDSVERKAQQRTGERKVDPRNRLNELTAKEWIVETISVWNQRGLGAGHPDARIERQHPAPFSFTDVSRLIRYFTKSGQTVLDPFVGVGSTFVPNIHNQFILILQNPPKK